jgi:hypothetical protein
VSKTYKYIIDFDAKTGQVKNEIGGIKTALKGAAVAAAALFSVDKIVSFGKQAMAAYDVQAKAERGLLVALKGRTDVQQRLIKQAQELQGKTLFGDEETIRAQSLIAAFVKEEDQIKRIIPLVQDLATAKGMDLAGAADLVSKTLGSSTNAMARYGIEVKGTVGSNERLQSLVTGLTDAFGGQAEEAAKVGTGALTQLANKWGDIKEEIGKAIVESDKFTESVSTLSREMDRLPGFIDKTINVLDLMRKGGEIVSGKVLVDLVAGMFKGGEEAEAFAGSMVKVNEQFGVTFEYGGKTAKTLAEIAAQNKKASEAAINQVTTYGDLIAKISEKNNKLKEADITDTAYIRTLYAQITALEEQKKAFEALSIVTAITQRVEGMDKLGTIDDAKLSGGGVDIPVKLNLEQMQKEMPLFQANMKSMGQDMDDAKEKQKAMRYAFEEGFMAIGDSVVNSLGLAEDGFQGFLGSLLKSATQAISMYLAQSMAASISGAAKSAEATGPAAVFTGPAFIAFAIASVLGAFAAIPKFETGGVVPGSSFTGDKMLARLNSGEEVLRRDDPRHRNNYGEAGRNRDRIIIPTMKLRKGDIYIAYHEAEKEILMRT